MILVQKCKAITVFLLLAFAALFCVSGYGKEGFLCACAEESVQDGNFITIETIYGHIIIRMCPKKAPNHVKRIKELAEEGFYDGLVFHRVIPDFMAQTGDPNGNGTGGSSKPALKAEFNDIKHVAGTVSMARSQDINSANSQFFIVLTDQPHLDHQYTAFGKVVFGMDAVRKLKAGSSANNGTVKDPDKILKMFVGKVMIPDKKQEDESIVCK